MVTESEYLGDVIGDMNRRRGQVTDQGTKGTAAFVHGFVPLAEMFGYATDLRSKTQGRGSFTMHFGQYEEVPKSVGEEIIARVQGKVAK